MSDAWVEVPGAALRMRVASGSGTPIVLVHGGPGMSFEYLEPFEALAPANTVVRYDQRSAGRSRETSPFRPGPDVLDVHVADLEAVRVALGAPQIHVVGHSWGGLVAAMYAATHPAAVASLVAIDAVAPDAAARAAGLTALGARVRALQAEGFIVPELPVAIADDATPFLHAIMPAYFVNPRHPSGRSLNGVYYRTQIAGATFAALAASDAHVARLAHVAAPSLVIACEVPFGAMGAAIAKALPAERVELVHLAAGHLPWLERDDVIERVGGFVARASARFRR